MFLRLPDTTRSDIVLKSEDSAPRIIIVPAAGWELDTPNRLLASERAMCDALQAASKDVFRESWQELHGVEFQRGTSIDYLVVNAISHTTKALLHAVTNPELVDGPTSHMLCADYPAVGRLFLLSESGCWDATALLPAIPDAPVRVVEPSGADFFGRVVDFFRETFGEDLPITISIPPFPRKTSIPRQDAGPTGRDDS